MGILNNAFGRWLVPCLLIISLCMNNNVTEEGIYSKHRKRKLKTGVKNLFLGFMPGIHIADSIIIACNIVWEVLILLGITLIFIDSMTLTFYYRMTVIVLFIINIVIILKISLRHAEKIQIPQHQADNFIETKGTIDTFKNAGYIYHYLYTCSKESEHPKRVVIFLPYSYYTFMDVNGTGYGIDQFIPLSNVGAYEELSDLFVENGCATLRIELDRTQTSMEHTSVLNQVGEVVQEILKAEDIKCERYLLAHGDSNRLLKELVNRTNINGIISLCGAALNCKDEIAQVRKWNNIKNDKKFDKIYVQLICENILRNDPDLFEKEQEDCLKELYEIAEHVPIFVGYVQQDPYYNENIPLIIKDRGLSSIDVVKFEQTDFTFRKISPNQKIHYDGYLWNKENIYGNFNTDIGKYILQWMEKNKITI